MTNRTLLGKCRLVQAKPSFSRHSEIASVEMAIWPRPNTFFRAALNTGFPFELEKPAQVAAMARIASARLLGGACQAEHRAGQNFVNLYLCLPTNRCFVDAKRLLLGAWNLQWILVIKTGRLVRAKRPLLETHGKAHSTSVAPGPSEAASVKIHLGHQHKTCVPLRPNTTLFCDAGLRPPAEDDE